MPRFFAAELHLLSPPDDARGPSARLEFLGTKSRFSSEPFVSESVSLGPKQSLGVSCTSQCFDLLCQTMFQRKSLSLASSSKGAELPSAAIFLFMASVATALKHQPS